MTKKINNDNYLCTGDICRALGFVVTSDFIKARGIAPAYENTIGYWWLKSDLQLVRMALITHLAKQAAFDRMSTFVNN